MKSRFLVSFILICTSFTGYSQGTVGLIPEPVKIIKCAGDFELSENTRIITNGNEAVLQPAKIFTERVNNMTGIKLAIVPSAKGKNVILRLNLIRDNEIGDEGYMMEVKPSGIEVSANSPAGIFYGLQSLQQLISLNCAVEKKGQPLLVPAVSVVDYPRFGWRGLMLDDSRHFFGKVFLKEYLDRMSEYKYNVFHWHLTDDPGWRIEIKQYPKLTEIGAWRVPRTGVFYSMPAPQSNEKPTYGGYYTQQDIREIVKYAADRFITVVPEIDVPGHSRSLIAAYPQASCSGNPTTVYAGEYGGPEENVLCAGNEVNFEMLANILNELVDIFPGRYIHIGGDEVCKDFWENCPKCQRVMYDHGLKNGHELQSYFIKRVEKIVESKGKKLIGWDEILEGGLAPNATVMSWRGMEGGIKAASEGHEVVMTPTDFCYLDYMQGEPVIEGFPYTWSSLRLTQVYKFEPVPDGIEAKYILGGQGNVWTEMIEDERQVEYMTWPRALAMSEVLWTPKEKRNPEYFFERMEKNLSLLDRTETNYARSVFDPMITPVKESSGEIKVAFGSEFPGLDVYYSFNFSFPDQYSEKYEGAPVAIPTGAVEVKAITWRDGKPVGRMLKISIDELKSRL
ncbi:beta-N-acetylhexosaminidase [Gaoshiqia sp. Z1-71]|uniref:beta-N-acetylhexosaminidase n=1 Tax=Gaoshiqia hydrogeniformans TaxID=3290090 RepID=UPI003BF86EE9